MTKKDAAAHHDAQRAQTAGESAGFLVRRGDSDRAVTYLLDSLEHIVSALDALGVRVSVVIEKEPE